MQILPLPFWAPALLAVSAFSVLEAASLPTRPPAEPSGSWRGEPALLLDSTWEKSASADDPKKKSDKKNAGEGKHSTKAKNADDKASPAATGSAADCRIGNASKPLKELPEASGIAVSRRNPGTLWAHVDAYRGSAPAIFALDTSGNVKGRVTLEGVKVDDWEDVAVGACGASTCLYIADVGDNQGSRRDITVYRVKEPATSESSVGGAEALKGTYPDGPKDAEALFVVGGEIFIVSKGDGGPVSLYRFPSAKGSGPLQKVGTLTSGKTTREGWITGASASPDDKWVVLRTHGSLSIYDAAAFTKGDFSSSQRFDLKGGREPQGEGVALGRDGAVYLVGEGGGKGAPGTFIAGACNLR